MIMDNVVILFLYSFNGFFFHMLAVIREGVLRYDLILLVLLVKLYLEVVFFRVDLIGQFGLLDDVPHEFEVIEEEHELPDKPHDY